jgi:hypothetical protein
MDGASQTIRDDARAEAGRHPRRYRALGRGLAAKMFQPEGSALVRQPGLELRNPTTAGVERYKTAPVDWCTTRIARRTWSSTFDTVFTR